MNALVTEQAPQTTAVVAAAPKSPGQCHRSERSSQKGGPGLDLPSAIIPMAFPLCADPGRGPQPRALNLFQLRRD